jgi:predicted MFS family arabinose efflux permease
MQNNYYAKSGVYISWFVLAAFFLYQYILRISPGVLINEIRHDFYMNADEFAILGSMYYYGYSLMQVPLGVIIDKVGIRRTALCSIFLCIAGTLLFAFTRDPMIAYISRFIAGVGAASSFMSVLKLSNDYLPVKLRSVAIGAALTAGAVGALITGAPLNYLLKQFSSWQVAFVIFATTGLFIWLLAFFYLPAQKREIGVNQKQAYNIKNSLLKIIKTKPIMIYAFIAIGLYAPLSVMGDLWGTAFLMKKLSLSREIASPILMNVYIGMAVGSIVLPYLAEKYKILDQIIIFSILVLLVLFAVLVYLPNLDKLSLVSLLILIGFFCGAEMLCFNAVLRYTDSHTSGLTIGVVNTLNMLGGAIMQQIIGIYLDATWQGSFDKDGLRIYSIEEFVEAFSILVIIIGVCAIVACFTLNRQKKHR